MSDNSQPMNESNWEFSEITNVPIAIKVIIIGPPAVGKTSLRRVFSGDDFREDYLPTMGADYSLKKIKKNEKSFHLTLWDLSGQPKYYDVHPQYYIGAHGVIVVYESSDENPTGSVINWLNRYLDYSGKHIGPILIVQNKIDLINANEEQNNVMKHNELVDKVKIYFDNKFPIYDFRVSAKTGENVNHIFNEFLSLAIKQRDVPVEYELPSSDIENNYNSVVSTYLLSIDSVDEIKIIARSPPKIIDKSTISKDYDQDEIHNAQFILDQIKIDDHSELETDWYKFGLVDKNEPTVFKYIIFRYRTKLDENSSRNYILGFKCNRSLLGQITEKQNTIETMLKNRTKEIKRTLSSSDYDLSDEIDRLAFTISSNHKLHIILNEIRIGILNLINP